MVVISMSVHTAMPYAAARLLEDLNMPTASTITTNKPQFTDGM